jgi:hypothetical protein
MSVVDGIFGCIRPPMDMPTKCRRLGFRPVKNCDVWVDMPCAPNAVSLILSKPNFFKAATTCNGNAGANSLMNEGANDAITFRPDLISCLAMAVSFLTFFAWAGQMVTQWPQKIQRSSISEALWSVTLMAFTGHSRIHL